MGVELQKDITRLKKEMREAALEQIEAMEEEDYQTRVAEKKTERGKKNVKKKEFSFNSSKQVGELLFERLGLPAEFTDKGNFKTSKDYIEEIKHLHPVAERISRFNQVNTYYGTFVKGIFDRLEGDRIYPEFNVNGTKQARISHKNPNMGNFPSRDPEWSKLRGIFLPDEGEVICTADYGQIEICVAAHFSQDPNLLKVVNEGISQHDITAQNLNIDRAKAKTLNFAEQYGCGPKKIAKILECTYEEAKEIHTKYWDTYKRQKQIIDLCKEFVDKGETVYNIIGRPRHFERRRREFWDKDYRKSYSHLIQSSAADITNRAFYLVSEELERRGIGRAGWSVHDELIMFVKKGFTEEALNVMIDTMKSVGPEFGLTVPLTVDAKGDLERWSK